MREVWRDVCGFDGYYEVSNLGRIRSLRRRGETPTGGVRFYGGQVLRPVKLNNGYMIVSLSARNKVKQLLVHRVVAGSFLGSAPTQEHEIAHADGSRTNNAAQNLRWVTSLENAADRNQHGRTARGEGNGAAKLNENIVRRILRSRLGCITAARLFGVSKSTIKRIRSGKQWAHVSSPSGRACRVWEAC